MLYWIGKELGMVKVKKTSRQKARHGPRYPCPALVFQDGSCYVSRAAAPEGTRGDEVL